ncbi:MAG: DUF1707 domain-containing protein [Propionibacteriaceae bacterium]|nr:DUF1707 domain-containing protein [Propionibacteriaceae bacterium]
MSAEPRDVGPLYGGDQVALESDRQLVENLLVAALADRRISDPDYTHRIGLVRRARIFDDLVPIVRDLMN